jgi:hypothetical protein
MSRIAVVFALLFALAAPASAQPLTRMQKLARVSGKLIGLGAGVAVTAGLALFKKWNAPMKDDSGRIKKLDVRGYDFTLRQRHGSVVGPNVLARAAQMKQDTKAQKLRYNFVKGLGIGAKVAPRIEGRMEAKMAAYLAGH